MADQLAGQWYADATGLGDLVPRERVETALRTIHATNVRGFADGRMGAVNGMRPDGTVDTSSEQSPEVWVGTVYALAAFMIGRGLVDEGWETGGGRRRGHVRARALVPDARGVRRGRQLPRDGLPAAARHLGHRRGAPAPSGRALGVARPQASSTRSSQSATSASTTAGRSAGSPWPATSSTANVERAKRSTQAQVVAVAHDGVLAPHHDQRRDLDGRTDRIDVLGERVGGLDPLQRRLVRHGDGRARSRRGSGPIAATRRPGIPRGSRRPRRVPRPVSGRSGSHQPARRIEVATGPVRDGDRDEHGDGRDPVRPTGDDAAGEIRAPRRPDEDAPARPATARR